MLSRQASTGCSHKTTSRFLLILNACRHWREAKITELLGRGILLQGNFKSFADDSRPEVKARAGQLLDRGAYCILRVTHMAPQAQLKMAGL